MGTNRQESWSNLYEHVHGLNEPIGISEIIKTNENSRTENYKNQKLKINLIVGEDRESVNLKMNQQTLSN